MNPLQTTIFKAASVFVAFACTTTPAWAQIYKCVIAGQTHIQDSPCPAGTGARPPDPKPSARPTARPPIGDPAYEKAREEQRLADIKRFSEEAGRRGLAAQNARDASLRERGCNDRGDGAPYIGATAHWIRACSTWGAPSRVTSSTTALGTTEIWWYHNQGTLYFDQQQTLRLINQ